MSTTNDISKVSVRLEAYEKWQEKCLFLAGGVGALLVVGGLASDSFNELEPLRAIFLTLAVISGACFGRAKFAYERAHTVLWRSVQHGEISSDAIIPPNDEKWQYPRFSKGFYRIGYWLLILAAFALLGASWASVAIDGEECEVKVTSTDWSGSCVKR